MNCLNPLRLFEIDKDTKKIYGKEVDHVEVGHDGSIIPVKSRNVNPGCFHAIFTYKEIPCRTCYNCRKSHALQWSERCMAELPYHDSSSFLTLTYDDDNIPRSDSGFMTTRKRDLQLFWKRLRKRGIDIKYFACSEYGDITYRPHFHAIVFGLDPNHFGDSTVWSHDYQNHTSTYVSETLNSIWSKGRVVIGDVTIASARYVAGYVDKKLNNPRSTKSYKQLGIEPERLFISNGIGKQFYNDVFREKHFDNAYDLCFSDNVPIHANSYFYSLYRKDSPAAYEDHVQHLENFTKAEKRARRRLVPDIEYYESLDRENEFAIAKKLKKR